MFHPVHTEVREIMTASIAASGSADVNFYFPWPARLKRIWAIPSASEAAHSTQVASVTVTNEGTDGSGTATLAVLTNDSDLADDDETPRESSAWVADVAKVIDFEALPGTPSTGENVRPAVAAGETLNVAVAKAASTQTGFMTVGIEYARGT